MSLVEAVEGIGDRGVVVEEQLSYVAEETFSLAASPELAGRGLSEMDGNLKIG
jgi:hypothetical protein